MPQGLGINFIILIIFFVGVYFLLIRPQKKKEKAITAMRDGVQVGDKIITIGGICGQVVKTNPDSLIIMVGADKTKFEVMRWSISNVLTKSEARASKSQEKKEAKKFSPKKLKKETPEEDPNVANNKETKAADMDIKQTDEKLESESKNDSDNLGDLQV
ncbi:MAG: preprotein translocase subunit YajC [Christensenellales bacterium]